MMESKISSLLLIPFLLFLLLLWFRKQINKGGKIEIPGPWKLPLLGNLHQLAAAESPLPHEALRELSHKYGPIMHLQLGEVSTVVVSSPDVAKQIMKTHDLSFVHRPLVSTIGKVITYGGTDIVFAPYGDYWRQMRKICILELLSAKKVQSFSFVREDEVSKLIESVQSTINSAFDLTGFEIVDLLPSLKFIHLITRAEAKLVKLRDDAGKILDDIIKENQKRQMRAKGDNSISEEENLVQVLLRVQRSEKLDVPITDDNIKAVIWDMFTGGTDTSASVLEWAMSEMMKNPKVMEKAQAEVRYLFKGKKVLQDNDMTQLSYLKSVIKETLRLHPPVPLLVPRECNETCKINGYEIPIKTQVIINAYALGRDPNSWYEAERFIPERFQGNSDMDFKGTNFEYIPFGAGRRMCPGISFGLAGVELPLASLLYHFNWKLPHGMEPGDLDMSGKYGITKRRKNHLCLIPTPYNVDCY